MRLSHGGGRSYKLQSLLASSYFRRKSQKPSFRSVQFIPAPFCSFVEWKQRQLKAVFKVCESNVLVDHVCAAGDFFCPPSLLLCPHYSSPPLLACRRHSSVFADRSVVRSTRLQVIKGRRGYSSEREEKCTRVAGQWGSRVDALTRLEEDTEKENGKRSQTKTRSS